MFYMRKIRTNDKNYWLIFLFLWIVVVLTSSSFDMIATKFIFKYFYIHEKLIGYVHCATF